LGRTKAVIGIDRRDQCQTNGPVAVHKLPHGTEVSDPSHLVVLSPDLSPIRALSPIRQGSVSSDLSPIRSVGQLAGMVTGSGRAKLRRAGAFWVALPATSPLRKLLIDHPSQPRMSVVVTFAGDFAGDRSSFGSFFSGPIGAGQTAKHRPLGTGQRASVACVQTFAGDHSLGTGQL
jgi:hypothetical protein